MMKGTCMCGEVGFEVTEEPSGALLCHCTACRKCAGPSGSTNMLVKSEDFKPIGELRTWTRKGVSGKDVTLNFCPTCSTIVFARAESMEGNLVVKVGLLDDLADIERLAPKAELFVRDRVDVWCERGEEVLLRDTH
ncbi:Mss4-like protein [Nemania sp. FL0916]|nr:Mss4-like protein [Nemania sp. FL0916]